MAAQQLGERPRRQRPQGPDPYHVDLGSAGGPQLAGHRRRRLDGGALGHQQHPRATHAVAAERLVTAAGLAGEVLERLLEQLRQMGVEADPPGERRRALGLGAADRAGEQRPLRVVPAGHSPAMFAEEHLLARGRRMDDVAGAAQVAARRLRIRLGGLGRAAVKGHHRGHQGGLGQAAGDQRQVRRLLYVRREEQRRAGRGRGVVGAVAGVRRQVDDQGQTAARRLGQEVEGGGELGAGEDGGGAQPRGREADGSAQAAAIAAHPRQGHFAGREVVTEVRHGDSDHALWPPAGASAAGASAANWPPSTHWMAPVGQRKVASGAAGPPAE